MAERLQIPDMLAKSMEHLLSGRRVMFIVHKGYRDALWEAFASLDQCSQEWIANVPILGYCADCLDDERVEFFRAMVRTHDPAAIFTVADWNKGGIPLEIDLIIFNHVVEHFG